MTLAPAASSRGPRSRVALAVVLGGALLRLALAAVMPVFPDEAYYWDWSRHLDAGYFDHPPAIALLIRLGGVMLAPAGASATSIAVRLGPILAGLVAAAAAVMTARRLAGADAALRLAIVITCLPLAAAGLVLATPDAPLLAAAALGCYAIVRVLESAPGSRESLVWWTVAGLTLGLAFISKFTSILLPAGVFAAFLVRGRLRNRLREPGPYVAALVAIAVFSPVLLWNARHDWISFTFQLQHGLSNTNGFPLAAALRREGDYIGGQAALASPILFVLMAIAVARGLRRSSTDAQFVLAAIALASFGLFAYSAIRRRVEPNWPAPGYFPAIVLLATVPWSARSARWLRWGTGLAALMSATIYLQGVAPILPIAPAKDPIARAFGWRELAGRVDAAMRAATVETGAPSWAGGDRYQEAAEIAFHLEAHPPTFALNLAGRTNQYDLWPRFPARAAVGDNLVLALDESADIHLAAATLVPYFTTVRRGDLVALRRGHGEVGVRRLWLLMGWKGGWPR